MTLPPFLKALFRGQSAAGQAPLPETTGTAPDGRVSGPLAAFRDCVADPRHRAAVARILDAVESPLFLTFPDHPAVPDQIVPVTDLARAVALLVSHEGLDRAEFAYFPGLLPELYQSRLYQLDIEAQHAAITRQSALMDRLGSALFSVIRARLGPLDGLWTPCGSAGDILSNEVHAMVMELVKLSAIAPLTEVPVALAMLETLEAGAMPCGYLGIDEPYADPRGRLCFWTGPTAGASPRAPASIDLDSLLELSAQEVLVALGPQFADLGIETVGPRVFVTSKTGGFFLSSDPEGGEMRAYKVYLRASDEFAAAQGPLSERLAGLTTLADCAARFGPPEKPVPSIRIPGRPATLPGLLFRHGPMRISALSADGARLDEVSVHRGDDRPA